jgi:hypothetical protein
VNGEEEKEQGNLINNEIISNDHLSNNETQKTDILNTQNSPTGILL